VTWLESGKIGLMGANMNSELNIYGKVLEVFRSWIGFNTFKRVLADFPSLEVYVAGGVLRDIVLGRENEPEDFDFFLSGEGLQHALGFLAEHGEITEGPFGSPRWLPPRRTQAYCDLVPIRSFFNGLWQCENIVDVLNQFDFTGNAIAVNLRTGEFHNPQNGLRDLSHRVMRAVRLDYPDEPIRPGHELTRTSVLWFRILHYAAKLKLTIEHITMQWLRVNMKCSKDAGVFTRTFFPVHPGALDILGACS
jgi:hypothetical protein